MRARKEARAAKKLENKRLQAERRVRREGVGSARKCASVSGSSSVPPRDDPEMASTSAQLSAEVTL